MDTLYELNVLLENGGSILVNLDTESFTETTVFELKSQICLKTSFEMENLKLVFSNKILEDDTNIGFYGITPNSYIMLLNQSYCLFVKLEDNTITITIPKLNFEYFTICELKFEIKKRKGNFEHSQNLFFNGELLKDDYTLGQYDITPNSYIELFHSCVNCLFIKTPTKTITIPITNKQFSETTILELKSQIYRYKSIPKERQRLILSGRELNNDRSLGFYKLKADSVLHLIIRPLYLSSTPAYSLFIKLFTGKIITLEFPVYSFDELKVSDLISHIEKTENIPSNIQYLYYRGILLEENKLISHYNIVNESNIDLLLNIYQNK